MTNIKCINTQQFLGSSDSSKQSGVPSHCHDAGKHSKTALLVLH